MVDEDPIVIEFEDLGCHLLAHSMSFASFGID
jgi:hypothetical protein